MLCNPAGKKAMYDSVVAVREKLEAARKKVNENLYSLKTILPAQEHNSYYVEFVGTYDDIKERYKKAIQNLQEGKWEWDDTVALADSYLFESYAEVDCGCDQNYNLKGFNQRIEKVKDDYKV